MARASEKLYYRIGEVARLTQVEPHVLRYWETEFPSLRPTKSGTGQRLYSVADLELVRRIKSLLYDEGFTIAGARRRLSEAPEPILGTEGGSARLRAELQAILTLLDGG